MKQARTGNELFDLNILPARYRRRRITLKDILPWLLTISLIAVVLPVSDVFIEATTRLAALEDEYRTLQGELITLNPVLEEAGVLEAGILEAQAKIDSIRSAYSEIAIQVVVWSDVLRTVYTELPGGVALLTILQTGDQVALTGTASEPSGPLDYAEALQRSPLFHSAVVESIYLLTPLETFGEGSIAGGAESGEAGTLPAVIRTYGFDLSLTLAGEGTQ